MFARAAKPTPLAAFPVGLRPLPVLDDPRPEPLRIRRRTRRSAIRCSRNLSSHDGRGCRSSRGCPRRAPSSPSPLDPDRERVQRLMRRTPRPKPVGETEEVLLVDRVQHPDQRPLDDLVLQRRRPRAAAAARRPSGCSSCETASPGKHPCGPERADPEGSLREPARSPATSPRPRPEPRRDGSPDTPPPSARR